MWVAGWRPTPAGPVGACGDPALPSAVRPASPAAEGCTSPPCPSLQDPRGSGRLGGGLQALRPCHLTCDCTAACPCRYRLKRIQGVKGFISFKVPRALGSDLDLDKKGAPASKPAGVHPALGLLDWLFLAALALAAASWCIGGCPCICMLKLATAARWHATRLCRGRRSRVFASHGCADGLHSGSRAALGGTAALQSYCLENNTIGAGFRGVRAQATLL